jgi:hypothetical protein
MARVCFRVRICQKITQEPSSRFGPPSTYTPPHQTSRMYFAVKKALGKAAISSCTWPERFSQLFMLDTVRDVGDQRRETALFTPPVGDFWAFGAPHERLGIFSRVVFIRQNLAAMCAYFVEVYALGALMPMCTSPSVIVMDDDSGGSSDAVATEAMAEYVRGLCTDDLRANLGTWVAEARAAKAAARAAGAAARAAGAAASALRAADPIPIADHAARRQVASV